MFNTLELTLFETIGGGIMVLMDFEQRIIGAYWEIAGMDELPRSRRESWEGEVVEVWELPLSKPLPA